MSGSSDSSDDPKIGPRAVRLRQVWEAANMLLAAVQVSKHVSGNTRHSASGYGSLAPLRTVFFMLTFLHHRTLAADRGCSKSMAFQPTLPWHAPGMKRRRILARQ